MSLLNVGGLPGMGTAVLSTEASFLWGADTWYLTKSILLISTCVDATNTPTTDLRPGLVLGQITATPALHTAYSPVATDGSQIAAGVLFSGMRMLNAVSGSVENKQAVMVVAGPVKGANLTGLDQFARSHMFGRFIFDDLLVGNPSGWLDVVAKATDYTVVAADNNRIFTNLGAAALVTFTLPAIAKGLRYRFYSEDNDGIKITAATADTLVVHNDVAADTVAFSTTGRNIGAAFEIFANSDATKWLVFPFVWNIADDGSTTSKATITT